MEPNRYGLPHLKAHLSAGDLGLKLRTVSDETYIEPLATMAMAISIILISISIPLSISVEYV